MPTTPALSLIDTTANSALHFLLTNARTGDTKASNLFANFLLVIFPIQDAYTVERRTPTSRPFIEVYHNTTHQRVHFNRSEPEHVQTPVLMLFCYCPAVLDEQALAENHTVKQVKNFPENVIKSMKSRCEAEREDGKKVLWTGFVTWSRLQIYSCQHGSGKKKISSILTTTISTFRILRVLEDEPRWMRS